MGSLEPPAAAWCHAVLCQEMLSSGGGMTAAQPTSRHWEQLGAQEERPRPKMLFEVI